MVDKVLVFNIALDALRLNYQTSDVDNDINKAMKQLRLMYPLALSKTLSDLDLNRTATKVLLEQLLLVHPHYAIVYKYPSNCAKFRRIVSPVPQDNKDTRIPCATESINKIDVVVTNEPSAYADIQPTDLNLSTLNPSAALALGFQMAILASSLIVGKGSVDLKKSLYEEYRIHKAEAQEDDSNENIDTTPDEFKSEFIQARLGGSIWRSKI